LKEPGISSPEAWGKMGRKIGIWIKNRRCEHRRLFGTDISEPDPSFSSSQPPYMEQSFTNSRYRFLLHEDELEENVWRKWVSPNNPVKTFASKRKLDSVWFTSSFNNPVKRTRLQWPRFCK
jgi:hypothetical protein